MKNCLLLAIALLLATGLKAQNNSLNMTKLDSWRHPDTNREYNDCWGYAVDGREYAILGSSWGTHFFDVTDPTNIVEVASFAGKATNVIWRDFKTYGHYAYGVADGAQNSLQIFDLANLPVSVTKVYDSNALSTSSHNMFIDNGKMYLCLNRKPGQSVAAIDIFSLADPVNPTYLNTLTSSAFSGVHDVYVRNDTAYCSAEYPGLFIYDLRDPMAPQLISSITSYPDQGYNHSNWTTADAKTLVFADETDGMRLKLYDITDKTNPTFLSAFQSAPGALAHNPYIKDNYVIISYYKEGVQVFDITDPVNPVRAGFYDTYPDNNGFSGDPYQGCWGTYPFLPSGIVLGSDITYGLFVLSPPYTYTSTPNDVAAPVSLYPNPNNGSFAVKFTANASNRSYELVNSLGQHISITPKVLGETAQFTTTGIPAGLYTLRIITNGKAQNVKVIIQ